MPFLILILKVIVIVLIAMTIRATLPRYRFDQATQLNWKFFMFVWLISIFIGTCYFVMFW